MLRFASYDIVFQEVPDEVTLAINLSNCPNRCKGCHSPYLMEDIGNVLDRHALDILLGKYGGAITCVCFMGGDASPKEVEELASYVHHITGNRIKTGWYSGKAVLPKGCSLEHFDYIKLGPYIEQFGGLDSPTTNQRFYCVSNGMMMDVTVRFQKKKAL
ncbi:anaerobic ribonucleoside-triphosphate reductase activating protein [Bacteroides sp. 51]|uniref:anaerobic ribonucleoside-triphosphate reductase activating protein n=1 Tax=Bacteroides sp. 51 TaxID=2302938 RepID=UPI0013D3620F|nr:anaerobic ribonucleoside-triphosphate reductase activating protein [Bacteroides sp. 51]NDV81989.1 anaerobic ribonucleoside-triphosphate reductase activating protein [Bacteroides sp. 51]